MKKKLCTLLLALVAIATTARAQSVGTQKETIINVVGQQITIRQYSTLYVGEVLLDGQQSFYYLYSEDIRQSTTVFGAVKDCLSNFKNGQYRALVPSLVGATDDVGMATCSNPAFEPMMNSDWISAGNAGLACLPNATVVSSSSDDLYATNPDFVATCAASVATEYGEATIVDGGGQDVAIDGILGKLSATNSDVTGYQVVNGQLVKVINRTIYYDCESITVIYTRAELRSLMTETPLTFEAVEAGTISIENPNALTIEYKKNAGEWTSASTNPISITVETGDAVQFRGNNASYWAVGDSGEEVTRFTATNNVYVYGNVMSLIDKDNFATNTTLTEEFALAYLFAAPSGSMYEFYAKNSTIKNHPTKDILLPATTLTETCYGYMFAGCQGLTRAPQLPATTLAMGCYHQMFVDCTALTEAPNLPATTLADACYSNMFEGCTALTSAPTLPATTLADYCYMWMFSGCTALVDAPELPATTLTEDCYHRMFEHCTSLQKAPVLPAATLFGQVYGGMFDGCTSLNYVKCLATDIVDTSHGEDATTDSWLANVATTGTFVKADATDWSVKAFTTGERLNGIPESWTVVNASEEEEEFVATECPLTFEAVEAGTITVNMDDGGTLEPIQYKLNDGEWADVAWGEAIALEASDVISFRGDNGTCYATDEMTYWAGFHFEPSNDCYVYGNMMSLIDKDGFATNTTLTGSYNFFHLFQRSDYEPNTAILNHPTKDIVLPATTLTANCYDGLFADAPNITRAPELPATTLADWCYCEMFSGTAITTAPALPATTLAEACYADMFMNCTNLTTAPELPATVLAEGCYSSMFAGCTSLNYVKCLATDISADFCTTSWMWNVAPTGTFVKAAGIEDWTTGEDGIPEGWTVKAEYTVPSSGIGTFSSPTNMLLPDGLTAHYCTTYNNSSSTIAVSDIDGGIVPANTGVLMRGTGGETYLLTVTTDAAADITDNALVAVVEATHIEPTSGDYTNFMLKSGKFVKIAADNGDVKMPANRAYLQVLTSEIPTGGDAKSISLLWGGDVTVISDPSVGDAVPAQWYTIDGRKLNAKPTAKGLYIVNGKKVIIR